MKYKAIQRVNPQDRAQSKWYAAPMNDGKVTKTELAKEIVNISSLSRGDVSNVIESLIDVVPKYLLMGKSVNLGELGTLRVSFSSEGADTEAEVTANRISNMKIVFTPSVELKKQLNSIHFEQ
ncbi:MAG: HU family DNA-binding protein [Bacteroidales bacterium]|jgi:predicted histone-like DNA-binding protein|nr:HU family DNA-binding protein [Bacteroidales bacterium]